MRSKRIPAKLALDWGIATECVADGQLEATTDALVDELCAFSPLAQRAPCKYASSIGTSQSTFKRHRTMEFWRRSFWRSPT
jgi:enoyl-CoA hydratase/carnithine racemase